MKRYIIEIVHGYGVISYLAELPWPQIPTLGDIFTKQLDCACMVSTEQAAQELLEGVRNILKSTAFTARIATCDVIINPTHIVD